MGLRNGELGQTNNSPYYWFFEIQGTAALFTAVFFCTIILLCKGLSMKCPICNNTMTQLSKNLYLCEDNSEIHVFLSQNSLIENKIACNLLCIYPEKYEDNLYIIIAHSENQDIFQKLML